MSFASIIDHTLLKPDATADQIRKLCEEALTYQFVSVCVNPFWVEMAAKEVAGSPVKVCTVIGFPLGANVTRVKMTEAEIAIRTGAREIDMVMNVGALRSGDVDTVEVEIASLAQICHAGGALLKVILETALLTDDQKRTACAIAKRAGADFVKTSTGFASAGATTADIELMRASVGKEMGVKASGGIRTLADVKAMVKAGATRIGASASVAIVTDQAGDGGY